MFDVTPAAVIKLKQSAKESVRFGITQLGISVFVDTPIMDDQYIDVLFTFNGLRVLVDSGSLKHLQGVTIDYADGDFKILQN